MCLLSASSTADPSALHEGCYGLTDAAPTSGHTLIHSHLVRHPWNQTEGSFFFWLQKPYITT